MSELNNIIAEVQAIINSLNQTIQGASVWQTELAQSISFMISQVGDTNQADIKDCLVALRSAVNSVRSMQNSLAQTVAIANEWIAKSSGAGGTSPNSGFSMSFDTGFDSEDYDPHRSLGR